MTFPIHPNNYNSLLPAPHHPDESNAFSDGIRRVKQLRSARFECLTLGLVWLDLALITHQIVLDFSLSSRNGSQCNISDWLASEFRNEHPALTDQASMSLFITITVMSFAFLVENIVRNAHSKVTKRRFNTINVCDAILCGVSFALNLSLLVARISPLARDFVALLIAFRFMRMTSLIEGLTLTEKLLILRMLDDHRREESFNIERQNMLQTELDNRIKECEDLKDLIKSATLARNRLKQKQQLQMKQQHQEENGPVVKPGGGQDDSGHSSDSSPETPQDTASRGPEDFGMVPNSTAADAAADAEVGTEATVQRFGGGGDGGGGDGDGASIIGGNSGQSDVELTGVSIVTDSPDGKSVTSRM